jgi:hypothetical protein
MHLHETILSSTLPLTASVGTGALHIHDIQTGASLASFKQSSTTSRGAAHVETTAGVGGLTFASQADKGVLNVYSFQKVGCVLSLLGTPSTMANKRGVQDQIALKMVLPEKLNCIAVDSRGHYFAGGTAQGRIYLWEVRTLLSDAAFIPTILYRWALVSSLTCGTRTTVQSTSCASHHVVVLSSRAPKTLVSPSGRSQGGPPASP